MDNKIQFEVGGKSYVAEKFKPTEGRRIVAGYPISAMPKVGNYEDNEAVMLRLMSHVSVITAAGPLRLETIELINNHVVSWENLVEIEYQVLKFNCPFLSADTMKPFIEVVKDAAANYVTETLSKVIQNLNTIQK